MVALALKQRAGNPQKFLGTVDLERRLGGRHVTRTIVTHMPNFHPVNQIAVKMRGNLAGLRKLTPEGSMDSRVLRKSHALTEQQRLGKIKHRIIREQPRSRHSLRVKAGEQPLDFRVHDRQVAVDPVSYHNALTAYVKHQRTALALVLLPIHKNTGYHLIVV